MYSSLTAVPQQEEAGTRRRKVNRQLISLSELAKPGARQTISERIQQRLQPEPNEESSAPINQRNDQASVSRGIKEVIIKNIVMLISGGSF